LSDYRSIYKDRAFQNPGAATPVREYTDELVMPQIGNGRKKLFPAYSFQNTLGVPTSGAAAWQEPFNRYACVKNEALGGHLAQREFPSNICGRSFHRARGSLAASPSTTRPRSDSATSVRSRAQAG
jgi:hypothetical protein